MARKIFNKPKAWQIARSKQLIGEELTIFQKEFRRHFKTFITGAFAFVAALFWRDALLSLFDIILPSAELWYGKLFTALLVSIIAIVAIVLASHYLKVREHTE